MLSVWSMQRNLERDEVTTVDPVNAEITVTTAEVVPDPTPQLRTELGVELMQAASLAIEHELELNAFMSLAWLAYVESRPGYRAQLEEQQMMSGVAELRRLGRVGQA